jgi:hypothetical protein
MTRAIREGQNTPRIPRIPRKTVLDLWKRTSRDHFYPPHLRGVIPRRSETLRGMRGIEIERFDYPPHPPQVDTPRSQWCLRGMRGMRGIDPSRARGKRAGLGGARP